MFKELGIAIAMELIYQRHPCLDKYGNCNPCRVQTWMYNSEPKNMTRSLEQVHYKMYGTLR